MSVVDASHVLIRARKLARLTQEELSGRADISLAGLRNIEKGRSDPRDVTLQTLAEAFGCRNWEHLEHCVNEGSMPKDHQPSMGFHKLPNIADEISDATGLPRARVVHLLTELVLERDARQLPFPRVDKTRKEAAREAVEDSSKIK